MSKNLIIQISYGKEGQIKDFKGSNYIENYYPCGKHFDLSLQQLTELLQDLNTFIRNGENDMQLPKSIQEGPTEYIPLTKFGAEEFGESFVLSPELSYRAETAKFFSNLENALNFQGSKEYRYIIYVNKKDKDLGYLPVYEWTVDRWVKLNWKSIDLIGVKNV